MLLPLGVLVYACETRPEKWFFFFVPGCFSGLAKERAADADIYYFRQLAHRTKICSRVDYVYIVAIGTHN